MNIVDNTIKEPLTCSTFGQWCPIKISRNCINIRSCCSYIAFLRYLMWHVALTGHLKDCHENEACYLYFTRIFHHRSENLHPKDVRQMWNQASKVSLWGGDLHPLCGSLQELLDIGNTIHWKHWNLSLALSPCPRHYPNKTFSHLGWLCFVAILSMLFEKGFPKWNQSIKVQIKISNH